MKPILGLGLAVLMVFSTAPLRAQIPGVPAAPAAPAVPGAPPAPGVPTAPAAPAAAPPPATLWSFLGISPENCEKCRKKICDKPIGKMINNMMQPLIFASGGLLHPLCPPGPTPEDLAKLTDPNNLNASPAEAVAAQIQAEQAQVKAKVAAIRYLATVDCHYYPEAGDALVAMLRKDNNECVRFEAALALSKGCCCNKKTIAGLMIAVNGTETDGNKSETSERVRAMALHALNLCMAKVDYVPDEPVRPEFPPQPDLPRPEVPPAASSRIKLNPYYTEYLAKVSTDQVIQQAGRVLAEIAGSSPQTPGLPTGQRGVLQMWPASGMQLVKDEISFDEAALATPVKGIHNSAPTLAPVRASLGFPNVEPKTLLGKKAEGINLPGDFPKGITSTALAGNGLRTPVPWPLQNPSPDKNFAVFQPAGSVLPTEKKTTKTGSPSLGGQSNSPQPVPWPTFSSQPRPGPSALPWNSQSRTNFSTSNPGAKDL